jgi:hypothetical protein
VPRHVTITDVSRQEGDPAFVICNEASGRHFRANAAVVAFLTAVNTSGSIARALAEAGLHPSQAGPMVEQMKRTGVLVVRGASGDAGAVPKGPIEGRLISARLDLLDAAPALRHFDRLGRFAFSRAGAVLWALAVAAMLVLLLAEREKALLTLREIRRVDFAGALAFALVFLSLQAFHELGHAMAYRIMCLAEGLDPGPIRMASASSPSRPFPSPT